jgi:hypothetical protein
MTIRLHREHGARFDIRSIHADRASAALRGVAPYVGTGQAGEVAQKIDEKQPRLDIGRNAFAVHFDGD